jgi:hypothetical protein
MRGCCGSRLVWTLFGGDAQKRPDKSGPTKARQDRRRGDDHTHRLRVRHPTSNQQPATNNQQPTTNNQQPTTNNQQPTTNNQQPTTNNQQPTTNNQQPTTNNQQPTTNNQQPCLPA